MTRKELVDRIETTKKAIMYAGPINRRILQKHLKRMLTQLRQYDAFQAATRQEVG